MIEVENHRNGPLAPPFRHLKKDYSPIAFPGAFDSDLMSNSRSFGPLNNTLPGFAFESSGIPESYRAVQFCHTWASDRLEAPRALSLSPHVVGHHSGRHDTQTHSHRQFRMPARLRGRYPA